MRTSSAKSTKEYSISSRNWKPTEVYGNLNEWIQEVLSAKMYLEDAQITCFIPGLAHSKKKEPIMKVPYEVLDPRNMVIHHIIPLKYGGTNDFKNLMLIHKASHDAIHSAVYTGDNKMILKYRKLARNE